LGWDDSLTIGYNYVMDGSISYDMYIYIYVYVNLKKHGADMVVDQEEDMLLKNHDFSGNISKTIQVIM